jgi:hypothetical protein
MTDILGRREYMCYGFSFFLYYFCHNLILFYCLGPCVAWSHTSCCLLFWGKKNQIITYIVGRREHWSISFKRRRWSIFVAMFSNKWYKLKNGSMISSLLYLAQSSLYFPQVRQEIWCLCRCNIERNARRILVNCYIAIFNKNVCSFCATQWCGRCWCILL